MKAAKRLLAVAVVAGAVLAAVMLLRPAGPGDILLSGATAAPIEGAPGTVAVFVTIGNTGPADRLTGARSPDATGAELVSPAAAEGLPIPAGSAPELASDGAYLRLTGVEGGLEDGRLIPVTLEFERAGSLATKARIAEPQQAGRASAFGLLGLGDICIAGEGGEPAPAISLEVQPDDGGWTVQVLAEDFTFSEALAEGPHIPGTGHGHLYLGGLKLQRLYAPVARIGALPPGRHELRVTLNTNDHRAYVVDDAPVTATAVIEAR